MLCRETGLKKRVVITRMGLFSVFDNLEPIMRSYSEGRVGSGLFGWFDASRFPTKFTRHIAGRMMDGWMTI